MEECMNYTYRHRIFSLSKNGVLLIKTPISKTNYFAESVDLSKHDTDLLNKSLHQWTNEDVLIQDAFPYLSADERESILIPGFLRP